MTIKEPCSCIELNQLRERERVCPTKTEAECRALLRCVQECAEELGLTAEATPMQVVKKIREVMALKKEIRGVIK